MSLPCVESHEDMLQAAAIVGAGQIGRQRTGSNDQRSAKSAMNAARRSYLEAAPLAYLSLNGTIKVLFISRFN